MSIAKLLSVFAVVLLSIAGFVWGTLVSISNTPTGQVTVPNSCTFTGNTATLNFGSIVAGQNIASTVGLNIVNGGNTGSNILLSAQLTTAGNWLYPSAAFGFLYSNTVWSKTSSTAWASSTQLIQATPVVGGAGDSNIVVPASGAFNYIYFGLAIPQYQAANTYNQIITVYSNC